MSTIKITPIREHVPNLAPAQRRRRQPSRRRRPQDGAQALILFFCGRAGWSHNSKIEASADRGQCVIALATPTDTKAFLVEAWLAPGESRHGMCLSVCLSVSVCPTTSCHPHTAASPSNPQAPRHTRSSPHALLGLAVKIASLRHTRSRID